MESEERCCINSSTFVFGSRLGQKMDETRFAFSLCHLNESPTIQILCIRIFACLKKRFGTDQTSEERLLVQRPSPSTPKAAYICDSCAMFQGSHFMTFSRPSNVRVAEGEIGI